MRIVEFLVLGLLVQNANLKYLLVEIDGVESPEIHQGELEPNSEAIDVEENPEALPEPVDNLNQKNENNHQDYNEGKCLV